MVDCAIVIPARYQSSRFPGKPLAEICGVSMIKRVWEQCIKVLPNESVYVATDNEQIADHCRLHQMQVVWTSDRCLTGTDRLSEANQSIGAELVINVQGDEPLIQSDDIRMVIDFASRKPGQIINAMCPIEFESDFRSSTVPKVVVRPDGRLLYISRSPIPTNKSHDFVKAWKQVCVYAFPGEALAKFASCNQKTQLEEIEDIEILRFLELGYEVSMVEVSSSSIAVDVPADVKKVEEAISAIS